MTEPNLKTNVQKLNREIKNLAARSSVSLAAASSNSANATGITETQANLLTKINEMLNQTVTVGNQTKTLRDLIAEKNKNLNAKLNKVMGETNTQAASTTGTTGGSRGGLNVLGQIPSMVRGVEFDQAVHELMRQRGLEGVIVDEHGNPTEIFDNESNPNVVTIYWYDGAHNIDVTDILHPQMPGAGHKSKKSKKNH